MLVQEKCDGCRLCGEKQICGYGPPPGEARAVIVGEAPGREEAAQGVPFVGKSGQLLRAVLRSVGLDPKEVYFTNVVKCRPPRNLISENEISHCRQDLAEELRPYTSAGVPVGLLGGVPARTVIGKRFNSKMRGQWQMKGKVLPTWHPAYLLRQPVAFWDFYYAMKKLARGPIPVIDPSYKLFHWGEFAAAGRWLEDLRSTHAGRTFCVDVEAEGLDYQHDKVLCMAIAFAEDEAIVLDEGFVYADPGQAWLRAFFDGPWKIVGHNIKFDLRMLRYQLDIENARFDFDSMLAHYVTCEEYAHDLKTLANLYFDVPDYQKQYIDPFLPKKSASWRAVPSDILQYYNVLDVCYNLMVWHELEQEMREEGMFEKPFLYPIMASQPYLLEAELGGMHVDMSKVSSVSEDLGAFAEDIHTQLEAMCGFEFNPRSPKQVSPIIYDHYKAPMVTGRKFEEGSTCKEAREKILPMIDSESELAEWLKLYGQYRSIVKVKSSYVDCMFGAADSNERVHCNFRVHGARTGRMSVRNPPLHSIPHPGRNKPGTPDWGLQIRGVFTAPPGWQIVMCDYSQAELRVAGCMSEDPWLLEQYRLGKDVHGEAARTIYGDEYTPRERQICKNVNFSQIYGGSPESAAEEADMDKAALKFLSAKYHKMMTGFYPWRDRQFELLKQQGYVSTVTGRRRRVPLIVRSNHRDAAKLAVNTPIQGSASELTLIAFMEVSQWLVDEGHSDHAHPLLTVHDSVILEVLKEWVYPIALKLKTLMEEIGIRYFPLLPWVVDVEAGESWGDVEKLKL